MAMERYVGWEEVVVSNDKGRREVHYYLKAADGTKDLAVVGREKSVRHMAYHVTRQFLRTTEAVIAASLSSGAVGTALKWKSRREVIDWLSSIVADNVTYKPTVMADSFMNDEDTEHSDAAAAAAAKDISSWRMRHHSKEFSWLGSAWNCRKRRKHYRSFYRNRVTISVHDFVHIMVEDRKRLVAYVEDLYEDLKSNKMVSVRWFHKVDEVAILLPPDVNDREIFFSLCLQDFSVECIDGLAAVLSIQHFEKFQHEARHSIWKPYLCRKQIDNDDIKPFDITQVQGYWSQEILRSMYSSSLKLKLRITPGGSNLDQEENEAVSLSGTKQKHRSSSREINVKDVSGSRSCDIGGKAEMHVPSSKETAFLRKNIWMQKTHQLLFPGCHAEILSQDSGIRGCWFRCVVLKKHGDKVKVQYEDVQDADETGNLEEWVSASRVAADDNLGIRLVGRPRIRPRPSDGATISFRCNVGSVVDAWWHDGWWEGIVVRKESEQKIHVYFPGEQQVSIFCLGDLRHSQEWHCSRWNSITDRPDIVSSLMRNLNFQNQAMSMNDGCTPVQVLESNMLPESDSQRASEPQPEEIFESKLKFCEEPLLQEHKDVPNLVKDCSVDGLRWISSRKRRRMRDTDKSSSDCKRRSDHSSSSSPNESGDSPLCDHFLLPKTLTVDHDNCKVGGGPLFSAPMSTSSLVMSR